MGIMDKWKDYRPQKSVLAWTAVGASVLTMVVGFTWGGWVTGGTARSMAEEAAQARHAELAATICVENFSSLSEARLEQQELVALSSYRQRQFVEDAEWAMLPGGQKISRDAASLCAEQVAAIDPEELPAPITAENELNTIEPGSEIQ